MRGMHRCLIGSTFAFVGKGIAASVINGVEFGARIRDRFGYCFVVEQLKEATVNCDAIPFREIPRIEAVSCDAADSWSCISANGVFSRKCVVR